MKKRDWIVILTAGALALALLALSRSGLLNRKEAPLNQTAPDIAVSLQREGAEAETVSLLGDGSRRSAAAAYLSIQVNSRAYEALPLEGDYTVDIARKGGFHNIVSVRDGVVSMGFSTCDNQLCVHQSPVSLENRDLRALFNQIVCLPNEVLLEVLSESEAQVLYGEQPPERVARPLALGALYSAAVLALLFALRFLLRLPLVKRSKYW